MTPDVSLHSQESTVSDNCASTGLSFVLNLAFPSTSIGLISNKRHHFPLPFALSVMYPTAPSSTITMHPPSRLSGSNGKNVTKVRLSFSTPHFVSRGLLHYYVIALPTRAVSAPSLSSRGIGDHFILTTSSAHDHSLTLL